MTCPASIMMRFWPVTVMVFVVSGHIIDSVDDLIRQWAPIIHLAPKEKYKPTSVNTFLKHVYPADEHGRQITRRNAHITNIFMKTKEDIEALKADPKSFIYGENPVDVPVYALVRHCNLKNIQENSMTKKHSSKDLNFHVTYWIFFPYNVGKEICFLGKVPVLSLFNSCLGRKVHVGNHVGDWEHITLKFTGETYPDYIYVATHEFGVYYKYNILMKVFIYDHQVNHVKVLQKPVFPKFLILKDNHPMLFSAWGSHGLWSERGNHTLVSVPRLEDYTGLGEIMETWKALQIFHIGISTLPGWVTFKGKWGNPRTNCTLLNQLGLCRQFDGPAGLLTRPMDFNCSSGSGRVFGRFLL